MAETRRVVRVFLASPGDLKDERVAAKRAAEEVNSTVANSLGYDIELVGWEDTISSTGRPQALINKELATCELFLGMMWRRWGTPPDNEGRYTSGFEEEFEISQKRNSETGNPEIKMFFKRVDDAYLADPGPDLTKVTAFRSKLIQEKKILFQDFANERDLEGKIRICLARYIQTLRDSESSSPAETNTTIQASASDHSSTPTAGNLAVVSGEGFLHKFARMADDVDSVEDLTYLEVARIRLVANSVSKPGNDEARLGSHDANLLFSNRAQLELGWAELRGLVDCGLKSLRHENTPLWHWLSVVERRIPYYLRLCAVAGTESEQLGAIAAMKRIKMIPEADELWSREMLARHWFSEAGTADVRVAGLQYLAELGTDSDLQIVRDQLARNDSQTSRAALEAIIAITYRYNRAQALKEAIETATENISDASVELVRGELEHAPIELLLAGAMHRNTSLRLACVRQLKLRKGLDIQTAEKLLGDSSASIRYEAMTFLLQEGTPFTEDSARPILVKPSGRGLGIWSSHSNGAEFFDLFRADLVAKKKEPELSKLAEAAGIYDDVAYFVLCEKYFSNRKAELRKNVDDHFEGYLEQKLIQVGRLGLDELSFRDLADYTQKNLTRRGLDILCRKEQKQDLERVRANLRSGFASYSDHDIRYLMHLGGWEDLSLIVSASKPKYMGGLLGARDEDRATVRLGARAFTKIAGDRFEVALGIEMPSDLKAQVLLAASNRQFLKLKRSSIMAVLNDASDHVRRAGALRCVGTMPRKSLESLLAEYTDQNYRYYNVIHWLDLGISRSRDVVKSVASSELEKAWNA